MIIVRNPTRRTLLKVLVLGLASVGLIGPACTLMAWCGRGRDPLVTKLTMLFVHRASAVVVGREYLARVPGEADPAVLVERLVAAEADRRTLDQADRETLAAWIREKQHEDFELGHTVKVNGWILSETEARLCALAALV